MGSDHNFRQFMFETKQQAAEVLNSRHVDANTKELVKNLLLVVDNVEKLSSGSGGQNAEVRLVKRRHEYRTD
jgi:hypothetical protein